MKKINEKIVYEGQWLKMHETVYETRDGSTFIWESVSRNKSTAGVVVVARLMPSKKYILIKQYRPAVQGYVLGFPAGLAFDNPEHAIVELKEETGYSGKIISVSPALKTGSTIVNDSGRIVLMEVDENDPANKNPVQHLEPAEDIEVHLVSQHEAGDFLRKAHAEGIHINSNLWYLFVLKDMIDGQTT